jgi:putative ABC transport system permease protein
MFGRQALVVLQIAASLVLLVASGVMWTAFQKMTVLDVGFRIDRLLMMEMDPSASGRSAPAAREFYRSLLERTRSLPGVQAATLSRAVPFGRVSPRRSSCPKATICRLASRVCR